MKKIAIAVLVLVLALIAFAALAFVPKVHATTTYANDGFESFNTNSWWTLGQGGGAGAMAKTSEVTAHGGTYSAVVNTTGSSNYAYGYNDTSTISTDFHYSIWIYLPSGITFYGTGISEAYDGSAVDFITGIVSNSTGYYLECGSYAGTYLNVTSLASNSWIHIEEYYVRASGVLHIYLNGLKQGGDWTTEVLANKSPNRFYLGDPSGTGTQYNGKLFYDDLLIDTAVEDATGPTAGTTGSAGTGAGRSASAYVSWSDVSGVSGSIFSTNNTGPWVNQTWSSSSQWGNYSFTLNVTVGLVVGWREYANDTVNNWSVGAIQTVTTTCGITFDGVAANDLDTSNTTVYAGYRFYSYSVNVTDPYGESDFNYVDIRFEWLSGFESSLYWVRWYQGNNTFAAPGHNAEVSTLGSSNVTSGNQARLIFKIQFSWGYQPPGTGDIRCKIYAIDSVGGDKLSGIYDLSMAIVTTATTTPLANTNRTNIGSSLTVSGHVYYSGTTIILPDSCFQANGVKLHNSSHVALAQGSSGTYSFTMTLENTVGTMTYHINLFGSDGEFPNGDYGSTSAVIRDEVNITVFSVLHNRINNGTAASFTYGGVYGYDNTTWSGTATLNDTATKNTVGKYGYKVSSVTDPAYGLTAFIQVPGDLYVIFDRVNITLSVGNARINVNSTGVINTSALYQYDGATLNGTVTLNDTLTKTSVAIYQFTTASISDSSYNLTLFNSNTVSIIYDQVNINTFTVSDDHINIGDTGVITVQGIFDYDSGAWSGVATLNDSLSKGTVGIYGYRVLSITDPTYGLTAFRQTAANASIIFDKVNINTFTVASNRINVGSSAAFTIHGVFYYNGAGWSGTATLNESATQGSVGRWNYKVSSITDPTYGVTVFTQTVPDLYVIFDKVNITSLTPNHTRLNVNSSISWTAAGKFEYDNVSWSGVATLNDTDLSKSVAGSYSFTVASITDPTYGITVFDGASASVVWDSLKIVSLQPVTYLGSGIYKYEAQIKYGSDSTPIAGSSLGITSLGLLLTSNSSGWVTFVLGQSNITATGNMAIYGVNDNNYGITIAAQNQTFLISAWNLSPTDIEGNTLLNSTIQVTKNSTVVWSSSGGVFFVPGDTFNVSISWLENLILNTTNNINIAVGTLTTNFNCTAYPFTINSVIYEAAGNATIANKIFSSNVLTLQFSGVLDNYILVTNYPSQPKYILNMTSYNMSSVFASGYLVLPHYGNQTLSLGYEGWGDLYVISTDHKLIAATLTGQRLEITANGTAGEIGHLNVYCGSRGDPPALSGFTAASYGSYILSGTYVFASDVTLVLDWTSVGTGSIGIGPGTGAGTDTSVPTMGSLLVTLTFNFPEYATANSIVNGTLSINWTGMSQMYIWNVGLASPYDNWTVSISGLPITLTMNFSEGSADIPIYLTVPYGADLSKQYIPCDITFATSQGSTKTVQGIITLELVGPSANVPDIMTYLFLIPFASIIVFAIFRRRSHP